MTNIKQTVEGHNKQWRSQPDNLVTLCKFFCVYIPYEESISKEMIMNNDNDLNFHSKTK